LRQTPLCEPLGIATAEAYGHDNDVIARLVDEAEHTLARLGR
jgi:hypothetical protein